MDGAWAVKCPCNRSLRLCRPVGTSAAVPERLAGPGEGGSTP